MKKFLKNFSGWVLFVLALIHSTFLILSVYILIALLALVNFVQSVLQGAEIQLPLNLVPESLPSLLDTVCMGLLLEILISALCFYGWWKLKD